MTLPTKNPIPSGNILDQIFNAEKIDEFINSDNETYSDRLGVSRFTATGIKAFINSFLERISGPQGYSNIGQVDSYEDLRSIEPTVELQPIMVRSADKNRSLGGGEFYYDNLDTSSEDNNCTVIVSSSGKRWKRKGVKNFIFMDWAGVQTTDETDDGQDQVFENCLKAAASESGFPNRIILGPSRGTVRLKEKHYIRGGCVPPKYGRWSDHRERQLRIRYFG